MSNDRKESARLALEVSESVRRMVTAPRKSREELERDAIEDSRRVIEYYKQRQREYDAKKAAEHKEFVEREIAWRRAQGWPI